MQPPNLKRWRHDEGLYTSPRFPDFGAFDHCRKFFIRHTIDCDCDEVSRVIKVSLKKKGNKEKFEKLDLL